MHVHHNKLMRLRNKLKHQCTTADSSNAYHTAKHPRIIYYFINHFISHTSKCPDTPVPIFQQCAYSYTPTYTYIKMSMISILTYNPHLFISHGCMHVYLLSLISTTPQLPHINHPPAVSSGRRESSLKKTILRQRVCGYVCAVVCIMWARGGMLCVCDVEVMSEWWWWCTFCVCVCVCVCTVNMRKWIMHLHDNLYIH